MVKKILLITGMMLAFTSQIASATMIPIDDYHRVIIQGDTMSGEKYELGLKETLADAATEVVSQMDGSANKEGIIGNSVAAIAVDCRSHAYYVETDGSSLYRKVREGDYGDWSMSSDVEGGGYHSLLIHAQDWFGSWGTDWWDGLSDDNWNDGSYRIDVDEDGHKYVANSLYIRYINITGNETLDGYYGGPYITTGTNLDDVLMYSNIVQNPSAYVKTLQAEIGNNPVSTDYYKWNQGNSVFQKHAEYRWYSKSGQDQNHDGEPWGYVYPMERVKEVEQNPVTIESPTGTLTTSANTASGNVSFNIKAKVDLPVKNDDLTASQISLYESQKSKKYNYSNTTAVDPTKGIEPDESMMAAWYSNVKGVMTISLPNGKTYTKNLGSTFNFSTNVPASALDGGTPNLTGSPVTVTYTYDENGRYMSLKNEDIDMYTIPDKCTYNYADMVSYITNDLGLIQTNADAITKMTTYHNSKDRQTTKTYVTITTQRTITLTGSLDYVNPDVPQFSDIKPLKITTKVFPSQPTTVLEGGSMYATIDAKGIDGGISTTTEKAPAPYTKKYRVYNESDSPESQYAEWHSDVKLDNIKFISQPGNLLYDSLNTDNPPTITSADGIHRVAVRAPGGQGKILANASDIGVANIQVDYSYHWKIRQLTSTVAGKTAIYRTEHRTSTTHHKDGSTSHHSYTVQVFDHWLYWWDKTYTTTTDLPQNGEQKFPFTIYSLSGQTVQK